MATGVSADMPLDTNFIEISRDSLDAHQDNFAVPGSLGSTGPIHAADILCRIFVPP